MGRLVDKVINNFIKNEIVSSEDREIYVYGLHQVIIIVLNILSYVLISLYFKMVRESLIFLVCYISLRSYAGGYHARTQIKCYFLSILMIILVPLTIKTVSWTSPMIAVLEILSGSIIFVLAPVGDSKIIIDIKADTDWVNGFIRSIEDNLDYLKGLSLKFNDICFVSGDRIKNPYFSNRGNLKEGSQIIKENSIRYTNLIKLIRKNAESFITYENLFNVIKDNYSEVDDRIIDATIQNLVMNEYLFTNLKLPAYCNDDLTRLIYI